MGWGKPNCGGVLGAVPTGRTPRDPKVLVCVDTLRFIDSAGKVLALSATAGAQVLFRTADAFPDYIHKATRRLQESPEP